MPSGRSACAARAVLTENRGLLTFEKAAHVLVSTGQRGLVHQAFATQKSQRASPEISRYVTRCRPSASLRPLRLRGRGSWMEYCPGASSPGLGKRLRSENGPSFPI